MDPRVVEAFKRCLLESVKDKDLPMEPSDFLKNHFVEYTCEEFKLNLKYSSFKKIGKLLEDMNKKDLIEYTEPKNKGHKVITKVNLLHPDLATFVPEFKLKRIKQQLQQLIEV